MAINYKLLRKVRDHILEEPRRIHMEQWLIKGSKYINMILGRQRGAPACNTVGCIAGWTAQLSESKAESWDCASVAVRKLKINYAQTKLLFHVENWPEDLQIKIGKYRNGTKSYAKVVAQRIDRFIETRGKE